MDKTKKLVALFLMICFSASCSAYAVPEITLRANGGNIATFSYTFDPNYETGLIVYDADVVAQPGASNVYVAIVIQQIKDGTWENVSGTFLSKTVEGEYALVGGQKYVKKGYWYRTQSTFIAYRNGIQTKVIENSGAAYYS